MRAILVTIAATVGGCATAPTFTPSELYQQSARLDGRSVTVRGYLVNEQCLYESSDAWERYRVAVRGDPQEDMDEFLSLGLTLTGSMQLIEGQVGQDIELTGVFDANYLDHMVDLYACGNAALAIE